MSCFHRSYHIFWLIPCTSFAFVYAFFVVNLMSIQTSTENDKKYGWKLCHNNVWEITRSKITHSPGINQCLKTLTCIIIVHLCGHWMKFYLTPIKIIIWQAFQCTPLERENETTFCNGSQAKSSCTID